jgi:hypothetical protein
MASEKAADDSGAERCGLECLSQDNRRIHPMTELHSNGCEALWLQLGEEVLLMIT